MALNRSQSDDEKDRQDRARKSQSPPEKPKRKPAAVRDKVQEGSDAEKANQPPIEWHKPDPFKKDKRSDAEKAQQPPAKSPQTDLPLEGRADITVPVHPDPTGQDVPEDVHRELSHVVPAQNAGLTDRPVAVSDDEPKGEPTSYVYTGGLGAVTVQVGGTHYEARLGDPVHLPSASKELDQHPDFERVEKEKKSR